MDPEDFLFDSLQSLYDYQPITLTSAGSTFTYTSPLTQIPDKHSAQPVNAVLQTPDTDAANWTLHASSIWASSLYLSDHLDQLGLQSHLQSASPGDPPRILELGASAGLPSIMIAKLYPEVLVTATDYPDTKLIQTLTENVLANGVKGRCKVFPFAWGTDPSPIFYQNRRFNIVIAADTLWNPDLHEIFIHSLRSTLKRDLSSRIYLVVGLHTGRYTIQSFLNRVSKSGFLIVSIEEKDRNGSTTRDWETFREKEDEKERRGWVIWIQLKWNESEIEIYTEDMDS